MFTYMYIFYHGYKYHKILALQKFEILLNFLRLSFYHYILVHGTYMCIVKKSQILTTHITLSSNYIVYMYVYLALKHVKGM